MLQIRITRIEQAEELAAVVLKAIAPIHETLKQMATQLETLLSGLTTTNQNVTQISTDVTKLLTQRDALETQLANTPPAETDTINKIVAQHQAISGTIAGLLAKLEPAPAGTTTNPTDTTTS